MKLYKKGSTILIDHAGLQYTTNRDWDALINRTNLYEKLLAELASFSRIGEIDLQQSFDPPMQSQEIWAAGVTYFRSKEARMEESKEAGGGSFYDKVYEADRPELFFKSLAYRTSGHRGKVRIRRDSNWNVPEPELTLFLSSSGSIEGYTIGNDVSSRVIEGENPLYLPQAKTYQFSAALGPCLLVRELPLPTDTGIHLQILRHKISVFQQSVTISHMKRKHEELSAWLFRETLFPEGTYLMTGTGIIPPDDFTLQSGDEVIIRIDGIGELYNIISQKPIE
jgi:2-dehydro-3-deoxy-D-arabinonate dehydratase